MKNEAKSVRNVGEKKSAKYDEYISKRSRAKPNKTNGKIKLYIIIKDWNVANATKMQPNSASY